jgi:hypothetical protein
MYTHFSFFTIIFMMYGLMFCYFYSRLADDDLEDDVLTGCLCVVCCFADPRANLCFDVF